MIPCILIPFKKFKGWSWALLAEFKGWMLKVTDSPLLLKLKQYLEEFISFTRTKILYDAYS